MQYRTINEAEVSRFGLGTKRMPTEDSSHVVHLDLEAGHEILQAALNEGITYIDTSYSNHKGEAESFIARELQNVDKKVYVATSYFELVDPRHEYVFQKQLKKLETDCIDFYSLEGTCDLTRNRDIDSGAVDFFFEQKEKGHIAQLGFSSELNAENLKDHLSLYPWDFVRLRVNFFDWFMKGGREQYEVAAEAGVPIIAHGALRLGPKRHLKPEAAAILKESSVERSEIEWCLRFVKSLEAVDQLSCNVYSAAQIQEDAAIFNDDEVLSADDFALLERACQAQKTVLPGAKA